MKLSENLNKLDTYPFHMPGHKRNSSFKIPSAEIDITEIDGFDNLHNPKEILLDMQNELSRLYKSEYSLISVNGSTCCILSAICGVCNKGDKIIVARNCHKSVYNACMLHELRVVYIEPEFDDEFGVYTNITQNTVDRAIAQNRDAAAIIITSPTYEGVVSRIKADIPVIVDSAHGSHFGFDDYLPEMISGDVVINSLHKTLPCLTQCAVMHINNKKYYSSIKHYMDIFETSSPSYVLLSSIDRCIDFLNSCNKTFDNYKAILDQFYNEISNIKNIQLFKNDDITRLVFKIDGYNGREISRILRSNGIETEASCLDYVILISTVCDTKKGFELLIDALKSFDVKEPIKAKITKPILPQKAVEQFEVNKTEITPLNAAACKISGESIFAYPPDIPLITIGEIIDTKTIDYIKELIENGVNVLSDSDLLPNSILTKCD